MITKAVLEHLFHHHLPLLLLDNNQSSDIVKKIKSGQFKIAVYGLGHVGSSIASVWLRAGAHVIGVDKSSKVLENAKRGRPMFQNQE